MSMAQFYADAAAEVSKYVLQRETEKILAALNSMAKADPVAIHFLLETRFPVGREIEDDPYAVPTEEDGELKLGMLGVINGICIALGIPRIQAKWKGECKAENFLGFQTDVAAAEKPNE